MLERNFLWNMGSEHESAEVSFYVQKIRVAPIQVERKGMHAVIHIVLTYEVVVTGKKIMFIPKSLSLSFRIPSCLLGNTLSAIFFKQQLQP